MSQQAKTNLTALIITYNEEKNIQELISNLNFVDDIIIVDSYSTDKTEEIALSSPNVKFFKNKFLNYSDQRNFALQKARNNWILFLDADERIDEKLKNEILTIIENNNQNIAYYFNRKFHFNKKPVHFCGLQNDKNIRLFYNNINLHYKGYVHEKLQHKGSTSVLENALIHYSYEDYDSYEKKMKHYGTLKALEKYEKGKKSNFILRYIHPVYTFFNKYIIRLGILDGKKGFVLSYLMAYSVYIRYAYLNDLNKKTETT